MNLAITNKIHNFIFMTTIILIAAIGFFASDIYLPSLPAISNYFNKNSFQVQLTVTAFLISMAIFQIFIGALSDAFGRKKILFIFISIFIVSSLGCYTAESLNELIVYRLFQGMSSACGLSIGHAIIADTFDAQKTARALSIVIPLVAFSPAVAPILGSNIEEHSHWRNIFLFLAGYGLFILILLLTPIIPNHHKQKKKELNGIDKLEKNKPLEIFKDKKFLGFALFMMNSNASYFAFLAASPFLLNKFGYTSTQVGYAFCAASFPYMGASLLGRRLSIHLTHIQIIFLGLIFDFLGALTMIGFSFSEWHHMLSIMIPVFIITIGNGLLMPFSSASAIALYPKNTGLITGTLATLQLIAASFGTFIIGILPNNSLYSLSFFNIIIIICTLCYYFFIFGRRGYP